MSNELITRTSAIESALIDGDLSRLTDEQRLSYYKNLCESLNLNPLSKPFAYLRLNGKLVLYALKDATDQLRASRGVSITKLERERIDDIYAVTAYATDSKGRSDSSIGAVTIGNLRGDALANALMKAETKAKRRVTLSICGLGMLDETEIETIKDAQPVTEVVTIDQPQAVHVDETGEVILPPQPTQPKTAPHPTNGNGARKPDPSTAYYTRAKELGITPKSAANILSAHKNDLGGYDWTAATQELEAALQPA